MLDLARSLHIDRSRYEQCLRNLNPPLNQSSYTIFPLYRLTGCLPLPVRFFIGPVNSGRQPTAWFGPESETDFDPKIPRQAAAWRHIAWARKVWSVTGVGEGKDIFTGVKKLNFSHHNEIIKNMYGIPPAAERSRFKKLYFYLCPQERPAKMAKLYDIVLIKYREESSRLASALQDKNGKNRDKETIPPLIEVHIPFSPWN